MKTRTQLFIVIVLLLILFVGIPLKGHIKKSTDSEQANYLCKDCNVLIIIVDALRSDHLGCYGYPKVISPNIDRLCKESIIFEDVMAPASFTTLSVASILTSTSGYGIENKVTLPQTLRENGYHTIALSANGYLAKEYGFDNGFDKFYELWSEKDDIEQSVVMLGRISLHIPWGIDQYSYNSSKFNGILFEEMRSLDTDKFLIYAHYMDVHTPSIIGLNSDLGPVKRYEQAISLFDENFGQVIDLLEELDLKKKTLIIITADHGEELYEHGAEGHSKTLYQEVLNVPLIIYNPKVKEPIKIPQPVSSMDIMPTILGFLNLSVDSQLLGMDLSKYTDSAYPKEGYNPWNRTLYSLTDNEMIRVAARNNDYKLILTFNLTRDDWAGLFFERYNLSETIINRELFNLSSDPKEHENLYEKGLGTRDRDIAERMEESGLSYLHASSQELASFFKTHNVSAEEEGLTRIKSLGYVN